LGLLGYAWELAVESDGDIHDGQKDYDRNRDEILFRYGIKVLRITNEEVHHDLGSVLKKIVDARMTIKVDNKTGNDLLSPKVEPHQPVSS
jgi:very-short-patch-repair endonuclease